MASPKASQALTLEQVYQMQSDWRAYVAPGSRVPRSPPVTLTALAQQACRQEGIDPRDLMYREIWQFAEPNVSEEIQLMRHAAFMQLREDKMECALRARDAIISVRSDREALSRAVEAKIRATIGDEVDGKAESPRYKVPAPFPETEGFAALYSPPHDAGDGSTMDSPRMKKRQVNEILARAKALEARKQSYLDAVIKKREGEAMYRLEHQELLREAEARSRAEVREQRIRSAVEVAKAVEERRQKRARRKIIKKFLKSAALQMTSLEDVEKEAELKVLREQKRKDYVSRAELKQEFRVAQIQQRIAEKEARVREKEEAKRDRERQVKLEAQRELLARQRILKVDVGAALRDKPTERVVAELETFTSPIRARSLSRSPKVFAGEMDPHVVLFVSPASFPSFGLWMLLQHFKVHHDVVNVQVVEDPSREAFGAHYSPLIPSIDVGGEVSAGIGETLEVLMSSQPNLAEHRTILWPKTGPQGATMRKIMDISGPLYFRVMQYVLPLVTPLMRGWEVALSETELGRWEAQRHDESTASTEPSSARVLDGMTLEQLVKLCVRLLANSGDVFMLGPDVSIADFVIIPAFHILLLVGYPLPEQILDYLAVFASVIPELIELEEPLCVLFQRFAGGVEDAPPYSPTKPSKSYRVDSSFEPAAVY